MPRIAYLAKNKQDFYTRLDRQMDIAARSLKIKRDVVTKLLQEGLYPYTKRYLGAFTNHFSTIGLVGLNEAMLNAKWIGKTLIDEDARAFGLSVLDHMRERLADYQELYGDLYNLEATPAESTAYRLAKMDRKKYDDIVTAGKNNGTPYYTNSSHLPVDYTVDIFDALDLQDTFQGKYTSGTVFHAFIGEKLSSWQSAANLVEAIAKNYKLPYYTLSPTYSICKNHGYLSGEQYNCEHCGSKTEVYSRITGYYRPVRHWNDGKGQEFVERREYVTEEIAQGVNTDLSGETKSVTTEDAKSKELSIELAGPLGVLEENQGVTKFLFTTKTCPNCMVAKEYLSSKHSYQVIDAERDRDLTLKYNIMTAPSLVVIEDEEVVTYAGLSDIRKFVSGVSTKCRL